MICICKKNYTNIAIEWIKKMGSPFPGFLVDNKYNFKFGDTRWDEVRLFYGDKSTQFFALSEIEFKDHFLTIDEIREIKIDSIL